MHVAHYLSCGIQYSIHHAVVIKINALSKTSLKPEFIPPSTTRITKSPCTHWKYLDRMDDQILLDRICILNYIFIVNDILMKYVLWVSQFVSFRFISSLWKLIDVNAFHLLSVILHTQKKKKNINNNLNCLHIAKYTTLKRSHVFSKSLWNFSFLLHEWTRHFHDKSILFSPSLDYGY